MHNIWKKFLKYIEDEDIPGLLRFCLILLPFVGGAIWGMGALIRYITIHQEILVIIGIAACIDVYKRQNRHRRWHYCPAGGADLPDSLGD